MTSAAYAVFKLAYQISPILLTGGIVAGSIEALPIVALTEEANFVSSLVSGTQNTELDDFFAHYFPLPGATLIDQQAATYPFANQAIAANAVITNPNTVSLMMLCPVRNTLGYGIKLATMMALQKTLAQHNSKGGTYSIVTPSYIYTNCIMLAMRDVSGGESKQKQFSWQLDFFQPLLSVASAQSALSSLMQKLNNGTQITGTPDWSSRASAIGLAVNNPVRLLLGQ